LLPLDLQQNCNLRSDRTGRGLQAVAEKIGLKYGPLSATNGDLRLCSTTIGALVVPGDLDGFFFGLFFSGFPDLLLIAGLAPLCGLPWS